MTLAAAPAPPLAFDCRIEGAAMLRPPMAEIAICERIRHGLERGLKRRVLTSKNEIHGKTNWIRAEVKFRRPGIAAAYITLSRDSKSLKYPELSVSVMDRPLDSMAVDMLADTIADYAAGH
ncbi:MAG TPA: hypothetical protein VE053_08720 [Allosphingosinicella sp.]|nr:hypothetical protein [Allosphingosinicella sp.]